MSLSGSASGPHANVRAPRAGHRRMSLILLSILAICCGGVLRAWYLAGAFDTAIPFRLPSLASHLRAPNFHLVDIDNRARSLADFRGKVVVIFFGYTHCPQACPTELFKLAQVMRRLGEKGSQVQVLLITLDPQRDTPQLLKGYVGAFDPSFIGLTGTSAQIDRVAADYHVEFSKVRYGDADDYWVDHSTVTYVIDKEGYQRLFANMDTRVDDFVNDLRLLANAR